jgi:PelA/Pel-15E family pectate lyase
MGSLLAGQSCLSLLKAALALWIGSAPVNSTQLEPAGELDVQGFLDGAHHWYDINDAGKIIMPLPARPRYKAGEVRKIADNILLFQKTSGGWPKNYDMLAILDHEQRRAVLDAKSGSDATFDNGATHSHVDFLARAFTLTRDPSYKTSCLKGIDFILAAQYANGGWPQSFPDLSGYRKYITFNDGVMIGVMKVLRGVVQNSQHYAFIDEARRSRVLAAYNRGLECILGCQVVEKGIPRAWCQQHDAVDLSPRPARAFEPAALCSRESAEIVLFLMSLDSASDRVRDAVRAAVAWFEHSQITGIRVREIQAPTAHFQYHTVSFDRIVEAAPGAPRIWARFYELGTGKPLFCNRDSKPVYSLAEVDRERRTGYQWYTYAPEEALRAYMLHR